MQKALLQNMKLSPRAVSPKPFELLKILKLDFYLKTNPKTLNKSGAGPLSLNQVHNVGPLPE